MAGPIVEQRRDTPAFAALREFRRKPPRRGSPGWAGWMIAAALAGGFGAGGPAPRFWTPAVRAAAPESASEFSVVVEVDFGEDVGQNLGTLFEATDADGRVLAGAGFQGLYNTTCRADRLALQFFVRPGGLPTEPECQPLPRFSADTGVYLGDSAGSLFATGSQVDGRAHRWDPAAGVWDPPAGAATLRHGDGEMLLGGVPLSFRNSRIVYDGKTVVAAPDGESIHHAYYALGHLFFFHDRPGTAEEGGFTRVCALAWKPGGPAPQLSRAVTFPTVKLHETTWAWGQIGGKVLTVTNWGSVIACDGRSWTTLREQDGRSYQVYSMLNYGDRLLLGQYPDGSLHESDGTTLTQRQRWPPPMPGVAGHAREAQSLAIYRGELHAGVWPWAELWRLDRDREAWSLVRRLFTGPPPSAAVGHPFEAEIAALNRADGGQRVANDWGQRVTSLSAVGDSLYAGTSNKGGLPRPSDYAFVGDEVLAEYGLVHRLRLPGQLAAGTRWVSGPTSFRFVVGGGRMRVLQDGRELASAPLEEGAARSLGGARISWGKGVFGPLAGTLVGRASE